MRGTTSIESIEWHDFDACGIGLNREQGKSRPIRRVAGGAGKQHDPIRAATMQH